MADFFISFVEEDASTALGLARSLDANGYSAWCYQRDAIAGVSYLVQTGEQIASCGGMIIIVSTKALASHQMRKEIVRGHEEDKPLFPVLLDVSDSEYKRRQPEWREAIGGATSISLDSGFEATALSIIAGLKRLGVAHLSIVPSMPRVSQFLFGHYLAQLTSRQLPSVEWTKFTKAMISLGGIPPFWVSELQEHFIIHRDIFRFFSAITFEIGSPSDRGLWFGVVFRSLHSALTQPLSSELRLKNIDQFRTALSRLEAPSEVTDALDVRIDACCEGLKQVADGVDDLVPMIIGWLR